MKRCFINLERVLAAGTMPVGDTMLRWNRQNKIGALLAVGILLAGPAFASVPTPSPEAPGDLEALLGTVSDHRLVFLDADEIRAAADAGLPVDLDLGFDRVRVQMSFAPQRAPDYVAGRWDVNGSFQRVFEPRVPTYRGDAFDAAGTLDAEGSEVRATLLSAGFSGYVITPTDTYNVQPVSEEGSGRKAHVVYRNADLLPWVAADATNEDGEGHEDEAESLARALGGPSVLATATDNIVRIVLLGDDQYVSQQGSQSSAFSAMESDMNLVEGIFSTVTSFDFQIVAKIQVGDAELGGCWSASSMTNSINPALNQKYRAGQLPEFHMAHLWSGRDLRDTCDSGGSLYGYGDGTVGYERMTSMFQTVQEEAYFPAVNAAHRRWVAAHEVGHVFDGVHCDADFYFAGGPFTAEFRKSTLAPWATLSDSERAGYSGCGDVPGNGWIYTYNYDDRFSDGDQSASNDNAKRFREAAARVLPTPPTPNAPTGPGTGTTHSVIDFTFPLALCWGYFEIDWGDGTTTGRPVENDERCNSFTYGRVWLEAGNYNVRWRYRDHYHGTWSDWSGTKTISVSCWGDDPGAGSCDAPNSFSSAPTAPASPFNGWILPGDTGDYYKVSVPSGSTLSVTMTPPGCSDFNLAIYRSDGTLATTSSNTGCQVDSASTKNTFCCTGDFRIRVYPVSGSSSGGSYQVSYSIVGNQPPAVSITSPASGATVSGSVTITGTASDSDGTVQWVEVRIDSGAWQTVTGTTSWSRQWDTTAVANGAHTISARSWDGTAYSSVASVGVTVSNGGGGGGEIARYDGVIQSTGEFSQSGTFITFTNRAGGAPIEVTYRYCYLANSNGRSGQIRTVFDGSVVDTFNFQTPYTGGGTCDPNNVNTFATRTFTLNTGISSSLRFDYTNGDWRVAIGNIVVTGAGSGGDVFFDNVENGLNGWTASGLWKRDTRKSVSPSTSWWYGQGAVGSENYNTGATNSGHLWSPWITIPSSGTPTLSFQSWYETEDTGASWDTKKVFVSTDGATIPSTHLLQVSGTNLQWVAQSASLSGYAGQQVKLVFEFHTQDPNYNDFDGWFIDDIRVTAS